MSLSIKINIDSSLYPGIIRIRMNPFVFDVWGDTYTWQPRMRYFKPQHRISSISVSRYSANIEGEECWVYSCFGSKCIYTKKDCRRIK